MGQLPQDKIQQKYTKVLGAKIWVVECSIGSCWLHSRRSEETTRSQLMVNCSHYCQLDAQQFVCSWTTPSPFSNPMIRKNQTSVDLDKVDQTGDITANHCKKKKQQFQNMMSLLSSNTGKTATRKRHQASPHHSQSTELVLTSWKLQEGSFQFNFILKRF